MKSMPPLKLKAPRLCSHPELSACLEQIAAMRTELPAGKKPAAKTKVRLPHGEVVTVAKAAEYLDWLEVQYRCAIRDRVQAN